MPDLVTSMAWNRETGPPWHGKGTPLPGLATAEQCIRTAGLDWTVAKMPLRIADEAGLAVPGVMAVVRMDRPVSDRRRILGVVGEEYRPLQNWEAFDFFDSVVGAGKAIYETAGVIEDGKRVWLLAKLPDLIRIRPNDAVQPYVLLANGHDGKLMVHVKFTPIRVVCQNTLAMALVDGEHRHLAVRHDRRLRQRLSQAHEILGLVHATVTHAASIWKRMADRALAVSDAERYFRSVFGETSRQLPDDEEATSPSETRELEDFTTTRQDTLRGLKQKAMDNFEDRQNQQLGIAGTLWAAYNCAVWAVDYRRRTRRDVVDDLCLADGARLKERALQDAEEMLSSPPGQRNYQ